MPLCRDVDRHSDDTYRRILSASLRSRPTLADERVDDLYWPRLIVETGSVRETARRERRTKYTIAEARRLLESFNFRASTRIGTMSLNHLVLQWPEQSATEQGLHFSRHSRSRSILFMGGLVNALLHRVYGYFRVCSRKKSGRLRDVAGITHLVRSVYTSFD